MMRKGCSSVVIISTCVLFIISLCLLPSCKESSPTPPEGQEQKPPEVSKIDTNDTKIEDTNAPLPTSPKETNVPVAPDTGLVPIELKLPKPMFVGTPQDTRVPNLEKPLGKPRPPFLAPVGTKNVALDKPVSSSDEEPIIGEIEMITDGDKEAADGSYVELGPFKQHVTVDLEAMQEIYAIIFWHYHKQARVYYDVIVQVADDPDFITNVRTLFNNDIDNSAGEGVGKHHQHRCATGAGQVERHATLAADAQIHERAAVRHPHELPAGRRRLAAGELSHVDRRHVE